MLDGDGDGDEVQYVGGAKLSCEVEERGEDMVVPQGVG